MGRMDAWVCLGIPPAPRAPAARPACSLDGLQSVAGPFWAAVAHAVVRLLACACMCVLACRPPAWARQPPGGAQVVQRAAHSTPGWRGGESKIRSK